MESNRTKVQQLQEQLAERERTIEQLQRSINEPSPVVVSDDEGDRNINEDEDDDENFEIPNIEVYILSILPKLKLLRNLFVFLTSRNTCHTSEIN